MLDLPIYIPATFILITILTLGLFHWTMLNSTYKTKAPLISSILCIWLIIQGVLAYNGFYYTNPEAIPPRFLLAIFPVFITMLIVFNTKNGKAFIDGLPFKQMTYLSIIRIPVEIVLYWLFLESVVPELMSFSGRNFDILAGITAPFVAYFATQKGKLNRTLLWIWNIGGLVLLVNIIIHGVLSSPIFIQQFAFEQPNIALMYFPFIWLGVFVAAVPLFLHFVAIRKLWYGKRMS